ncbi:ABC transporter permease [Haliangium sp.]|uniref:ABC transporter permease n=1 Tax=Haliangium sp. TaxID=2663208 RepID=UPI003D0FD5DC
MSWRLVPREDPGRWSGLGVAAAAVLIALASAAALFAAAGAPPLAAAWVLVSEAVGSRYGLSETLLTATPLMLCGLAVAVAYRVGLWNIGAEGQLYMGAFAAAGLALHADVAAPWAILCAGLAGAGAGALWAAVAALLHLRARVSEILATLMLNYVAIAWVEYWVFGPWKGADGFPYSAYLEPAWHLPALFTGARVHAGLVVAVALAVALAALLRYTALGYELRVIGASPAAARYAGIPVAARQLLAMAAAGALAGLAGAFEITGVAHRLHASISPGYGYTAIIVAFLAGSRPLAVIIVAVALAVLAVGGEGLEIAFPSLPASAVAALQGLLLVAVLIGQGLARYRLVRVPSRHRDANTAPARPEPPSTPPEAP